MPRIVLKDIETEKTQAVSELEAIIGRDPANGIVIDGPKSKVVSGRHARIFFQDSSWWIEDTSRNGTILDDERLQSGQRHAIKVGQVLGLGESGPRLRVAALESRKMAETVAEMPDPNRPITAPRKVASSPSAPTTAKPAVPEEPNYPDNTTSLRRSESARAGVRFEEPTEPMSPSPDWLVQVVLRATNTNQRFDVTAKVVKIGRSPDCNVQVPPEMGASVSRQHAEITIHDGGVVVRDTNSRNGTFVNGKRVAAPQPAAKSDLIMLGSGGPTFSIEDLHIVKGPGPKPPDGGEPRPDEPKPVRPGGANPFVEPSTDPVPLKSKGFLDKLRGR
jgi:pSer/pThr/pTyr-binding forkhead associated (FHA) protein